MTQNKEITEYIETYSHISIEYIEFQLHEILEKAKLWGLWLPEVTGGEGINRQTTKDFLGQ